MADTDLSAYLVVVIYQGWKGSTGYSVEVADIQRKNNTITVYARFREPAPREITNPLVTSPYYILKIKKTSGLKGDFIFVLVANGKEIIRQTHHIP